LVPFFENLGISEITAGKIQEYRVHPHQEAIANPRQASGPQHHPSQIVTLRQTLNTALRGSTDSPTSLNRTGHPPKSQFCSGTVLGDLCRKAASFNACFKQLTETDAVIG
jgi:hypothetical protein